MRKKTVNQNESKLVGNGTFKPDYAIAPGATITEALEERDMSQRELALRLGMNEVMLSDIVRGKRPITAETARGLELALGIPFQFWMNAESRYREHLARIQEEKQFFEWIEWAKSFPFADMARLGWVPKIPATAPIARVRALLSFLQVTSPKNWDAVYKDMNIAYRKTDAFKTHQADLGVWLRQGERMAQKIECAPYDKARFEDALKQIRTLSKSLPTNFGQQIVDLSAQCGVAVVYVPALKGSRASGATRWLSKDKAMIQLSLRHKSDDHFWFTFFHEAAHILKHSKKEILVELPSNEDPKEIEANNWSANFLIPKAEWSAFTERATFPPKVIVGFANQVGIAPGIVVGRLQREKRLEFSARNELKRKLDFSPSSK